MIVNFINKETLTESTLSAFVLKLQQSVLNITMTKSGKTIYWPIVKLSEKKKHIREYLILMSKLGHNSIPKKLKIRYFINIPFETLPVYSIVT